MSNDIEQKAVELKPCPSGHNNAKVLPHYRQFRVECLCSWFGPVCRSEADAITAWNTRAAPKDKWQDIEDLKEDIANALHSITTCEATNKALVGILDQASSLGVIAQNRADNGYMCASAVKAVLERVTAALQLARKE